MKSLITRRALVVNGTLGVLLTGGIGLAYVSLGDDGGGGASAASTRTVTVSRGNLTSTVSASGSIAAAKSRALGFEASGTVDEIYVKAGEKVAKGDKLAVLDQTEARENLKSATAALAVADDADTDTAAGYNTYLQAKNSYDEAERALEGTYIYAPYAGTITAVNGSEGGSSSGDGSSTSSGTTSTTSTAATGFMTISDTSKVQVEGSFTEADTTKLKVGQKASISFAALSGVTATGKVSDISTASSTTSNVVSYTVTISLTSKPSAVRLGQTATAVVTTSSKSDVLYVPTAAVTTAGGQSTVTVVENGKTAVKTVIVGIAGDSGTEITAGLTEGQSVEIKTATSSGTTNQRQMGPGGFGGGGGTFGGGGMGGAPGGGAR